MAPYLNELRRPNFEIIFPLLIEEMSRDKGMVQKKLEHTLQSQSML